MPVVDVDVTNSAKRGSASPPGDCMSRPGGSIGPKAEAIGAKGIETSLNMP